MASSEVRIDFLVTLEVLCFVEIQKSAVDPKASSSASPAEKSNPIRCSTSSTVVRFSARFVMTRIPHPSNRTIGLNLVDVAPLDPNGRRGLRRDLRDGRRLRRNDDRLLHHNGLGLDDHGLLDDDRLGLDDHGRRSRSHRIVNRRADQSARKSNARPGPEVTGIPTMMMVAAAVPMIRRRTMMPGKCGSRNRDSRSQQAMLHRHVLTWPQPASRRTASPLAEADASCCGARPSARSQAP